MPVVDLRDIEPEARLEADVCVVGSGPAGSTIARELAGERCRVVLLESGGIERDVNVDALNEVENVGQPRVADQWLVRNRMLGGSTKTWTGRCAPFDDIDFETRDWVPHSGWPFVAQDLTPFLVRSAPYLGIGAGAGFTTDSFWTLSGRRKSTPDLNDDLLVPFFWQFSKDASNRFDYMRLGKNLQSGAAAAANVILNATVTHINTMDTGSCVQSVEVRDRGGAVRTIHTPRLVLCAGGIENARLLLASNRVISRGVGNQNDLVGRFLMDHPRGRVGHFNVESSEALQRTLGVYNVKTAAGTHRFRHGLRLSPVYQRQHELLNCAVWLNEVVTKDDPWNALSRILRGTGSLIKDCGFVGSNLGMIRRGLKQFLVDGNGLPRKLERLELECIVEQRPDPESRITLSDRKDRYGIPIPRINWKISEQEQRTVRMLGRLVEAEFKRLGLNELELDSWVVNDEKFPPAFQDVAHPTGTTRMSADPKAGVVDANCQVHGVHGLFVAGSSIFPTSSHVNPTHMIVAMAIRLADTLKRQLSSGLR